MAKQNRPPLVPSNRINYQEITEEFKALIEKTARAKTIENFRDIVQPTFVKIIERYWHLTSDENYVEGEIASLLFHIGECLNNIMPDHLEYFALVRPNLDGLFLFVYNPELKAELKKQKN